AVDGVSWRILTEDFQTAYGQLKSGQPVQLPRKTTSFKHWSYKLQEYAQGEALQKELPYWLDARRTAVAPLPVDFPGGLHANTSTQTVPLVLSAEETKAILQEVPAAFHAQVNDILLTALAQALQKWTGRNAFLVDLEGHGREEIIPGADLTRTVGWFTSAYPVLLEPGAPTATPGDALKVVKEQLRAVPNKGIGYGLLRYLSGDAATEAQLKALPQAAIAFNYLGQFEQAGAEESTGHAQSLAGTQDHPLLLTGYITGGQLRLTWLYSANIHRRTTIENLSNRYLEALRALIAQCRKGAGGFTPSDFTKAKGLDQNKLDKLMSKIGGKGLKK
ncbi:MAG TPA: condensation domain-containing protein, partial [Symbiobacteriaceae bacterium]|nr:condensation domain-containing protein [Symbiobacteriaceae bacterium]